MKDLKLFKNNRNNVKFESLILKKDVKKVHFPIEVSSSKRTDEVFKPILSIESPFFPKGNK